MLNYNFPLGIASGEYFCNRVSETNQLIHNIATCTHTVLISPRRYGKTSLAYRAIEQSNLPHIKIDLYLSTSQKDIEHAIIKGINELIAQVAGVTDKLLDSIKAYIKSLKPSLEASSHGFKLMLEPTGKGTVQENICEALKILDQILIKKQQKGIIFIDEFQEIERVASDKGIEGAIRHVAQETKHFAMIFSGSRRRLLKSMFNDRNKPLYRLCDEIYLERIKEDDYLKFINDFSQEKWSKPLNEEVFKEVVNMTECHPYYFNSLLRLIFAATTMATMSDVRNLWHELADRKHNDLMSETKSLTIIHKKLLVAIANGINTELTGKNFLASADLSGSSALRALEYLVEEDFIEKNEYGYQLLDPLLKTVIKQLQRI